MVVLVVLLVAVLLGLLPGWIGQRRGESFGWWWLAGAVWFGMALPLVLVSTGERDRTESARFAVGFVAVVAVVNAAVLIGGWELAGL